MRMTSALAAALLGHSAVINAHAHPSLPEDNTPDIIKREMIRNSMRSIAACSSKLDNSGLNKRAIRRRMATVEKYRRSTEALISPRGKTDRRDMESVLATNHNQTDTGITPCSSTSILFASNGTCVLNPTSEFGPFWVKGEYVRSNLIEDQEGVSVIIDGQFIDAETCEPLEGVWWDMWNANSTGVYSGVDASNNGNGNDHSNINATFLRGIQQTDSDGVVQFTTLFPGHYDGRATHTHVVAHIGATELSNNTLSGGTSNFVGHFFWDQDLISAVEATYPYNINTNTLTLNEDDNLFQQESAETDPVFNYIYLGDSVEDGLFAWITIAINTSATYTENYSFMLTEDGGVAVDDGTDGDINGTGGDDDLGGEMPTGSDVPTGDMPTGTAALTGA